MSLDEYSRPTNMRITPVDGWDQLEVTKRVLDMVDVNATLKAESMGGLNDLSENDYTHIRTDSARLAEDEYFSLGLAHPDRQAQGQDHRRPSKRHITLYSNELRLLFNRRHIRVGAMVDGSTPVRSAYRSESQGTPKQYPSYRTPGERLLFDGEF
ncbi:hypothetical protein [Ferrimicrobium sp.]|uniref:hypothetical protein n=2 Tax=Ferrimicrobium sp. TaxID=2926050 RepID=UPI0026285AAC|nr:hypothetical protein [Ferrimicrobium sp.]